VLDSAGCVCVCGGCGNACRVGRSVVAGLAVRFGVGVVSVSGAPLVCAHGVPIAAWCGILGVNDTSLLQVAGTVLSAGLEHRVMVCGYEWGV
jgi:hypothetical protein